MAITLGKERAYCLEKEGAVAPYLIHFPFKTGAAAVPGTGAQVDVSVGRVAAVNTPGATAGFMGVFEAVVASGTANDTLVPIRLGVPHQFWVATFSKGGAASAATDFPNSTLANGFAGEADGTVGFLCIGATSAAGSLFRLICLPGRGDLGSAVIRGNIIEKAGTTYGTGQTLNFNTQSNWGTVGDTNPRVICVFNPEATVFGT